RLDGEHRRQRQRPARADVDMRAVARADGVALVRIELPLAKRAVVVGTAILDRAVLAAEVVDPDRDLPRVDELHRPRRQVLHRARSEEHTSELQSPYDL